MNLHQGEFVVMPDHFHAIIGVGKNKYNSNTEAVHCISTKNKFGAQSKNLASIIRGFKIGVTRNVRLIDPDFSWQPRFHDRIIRDDMAYQRISDYIINNPANW